MNTLLETALSNVLMAALLAIPAALAATWGRRPALTHGLFLLVLLKLVTPPLFRVPIAWPDPPIPLAEATAEADPVVQPVVVETVQPAVENAPVPDSVSPLAQGRDEDIAVAPGRPALEELPAAENPAAEPPIAVAPVAAVESPIDWAAALGVLWLAGSACWITLAVGRLLRFRRLLCFAQPASEALQTEAHALADCMGVRCPKVLLLPGTISPMLWSLGGTPCLLLPAGLVPRLRPEQMATLLAHELAHWRRGDHRVRWLEMLALALYWWCPLAWWARRQLQQAEEECCDAWVVAVLPDSARDYALALVDTLDFLSGVPSPLPPVASGVGHVRLLQRRLKMILRGTTPRSLTRTGLLAVAGLGVFLLPFVPGLAQQPPPTGTKDRYPEQLKQEVEKAKQIQQELDQRQRDLDQLRKEIELRLKQLHASGQEPKVAPNPGPPSPGAGGPPLGVGGPMAGVGGPPPGVGGPGGPKPPMAGAGGGGPMMGGMMGGAGGMGFGAGGTKSAGVEQRLEQVERKLDALLWEITNLRRDMTKGSPPQGFGAGTMIPPGWAAPPGGQPGKGAPGGQPGGSPGFPGKPGAGPAGGSVPGQIPPAASGPNVPGASGPSPGGLPRVVTPAETTPANPPAAGSKGN